MTGYVATTQDDWTQWKMNPAIKSRYRALSLPSEPAGGGGLHTVPALPRRLQSVGPLVVAMLCHAALRRKCERTRCTRFCWTHAAGVVQYAKEQQLIYSGVYDW